MRKNEVEKYLGRNVEIVLFDGEKVKGTLHKTGEDCFKYDSNLYIPKNYFFCTNTIGHSCLFRASHITSCK